RGVHRRAAGQLDGANAVRSGRVVRLPGGVRAGAPVQELRGSRGVVGEEEAQGQGVCARRESRRSESGGRRAGCAAGRAHRLRDSGAPTGGGDARSRRAGGCGVSVRATAAPAAGDPLALAIDRAAGARPIDGNRLEHHPDSARALEAMLAAIAAARRWVHFENYIIRGDATGRRFADALVERARSGVRVRVLYDALGSLGTSRRYWRRLTQAGVEVRAFHPLLTRHPLDVFARDHRKLLVTDGSWAMTGGLCIGNEWAGDPARGRRPWRDTMVAVTGPAAAALDDAFARIWRRAGAPLPPDELEADPAECGSSTARVLSGVPGRARIFEWKGPKLHAKTLLVEHHWARVGSSNLSVSSLVGNYELDLLAECNQLAAALAQQFLRDLATSREIVLQARRRFLPARLVGAPATAPSSVPEQPHKRSRYELGAVAVVTVRRVAGGLRRAITSTATLEFA